MLLSRILLNANQRFDLEDFNAMLSAVRTDSQYFMKEFFTGSNYILKGFAVTGIGLKAATIATSNATLIHSESTSDFSWWTAETGASDITLADADLTDNTRNYVELRLLTSDGTPVSKSFWDTSANDGLGSEFTQTVNTVTSVVVDAVVRTGGFSGSADRIPLCYIDVDASGDITVINDQRPMFFRLGTVASPSNDFSWGTQQEPILTVVLTGGAGTYVAGETVTFASGATATVVTGGTTNITIKLLSSDSFAAGDALVGGAANRTVVSVLHSFTGGDTDIDDFKEWMDAVMTEIKAIKGTDFWYQNAGASISGAIKFINTLITQNTTTAKFGWTAGNLNITDDSGGPADADVIGLIRVFGSSQVLQLTRQDGTGASTQIAIADGEVMYVTLPSSGNRTYTGTGAAATNYKVAAFADFSVDDYNFWLAFREGNKLYVRGLGELEIGEEVQIGDQIAQDTLTFIGATDESDSDPAYSSAKVVTQGDSLTTAIGDLDAEVSDYRFKTVPNPAGADKTVRIYPSKETDAAGKTIYTFIDPTFSSKFPRTGYSAGTYDGGVNNDQLVTLSFSDPAAGTVTVTATGPTFGAQVVGTFTTVGGGANFTPVSIYANTDDSLALIAGSNYASQALASADDALPVGYTSQFKICTIINEVDAGNTTTQNIETADILDRRDFENVTSAASLGTLSEVSGADTTIVVGDGVRVVSLTTGAVTRVCNLSSCAADPSRLVEITKADSGIGYITVTPNGADTIEGQASYTIYFQGDTIRIISDGVSNWKILKYSSILIQDFTSIGDVGDSNQQMAGHIYEYTDLDSKLTNFSTLAYYKFASGALTTDETGTYTLTNNNAATNTTGILNTNFATDLDGINQHYTNGTLLDSISGLSNGIFIGFWFKADDGQPASITWLTEKSNTSGQDKIYIYIGTNGMIHFITEEANNGDLDLTSTTVLPDGATDWHFVCINWDTTNGKRLWIDGVLEAEDNSATTLMGDNVSGNDFFIGAEKTPGNYFGGQIAQFIVADAILTQRDVDFMYSTLLTEPSIINGKEYTLYEKIQSEGDSDFESQESPQIVTKYNNNIYRQGKSYDSTDKIRIVAKVD